MRTLRRAHLDRRRLLDGARVARRRNGLREAQVSECLARAGVVWDVAKMIVTEGKKGYRLGVSVRVLA